MKMSEFANNILDKDMLIDIISHVADCGVCPFKMACKDATHDFQKKLVNSF